MELARKKNPSEVYHLTYSDLCSGQCVSDFGVPCVDHQLLSMTERHWWCLVASEARKWACHGSVTMWIPVWSEISRGSRGWLSSQASPNEYHNILFHKKVTWCCPSWWLSARVCGICVRVLKHDSLVRLFVQCVTGHVVLYLVYKYCVLYLASQSPSPFKSSALDCVCCVDY